MAQQFEILFLLPLFLLPLIFSIFKIFKKSSKITQLPPGPTAWPVIGSIFQIGKMPHITLTNFAKTFGPLISLRLGTQCLVVGSSPSVAIEIFKTHDRILSGRHVPNAVRSKGSDHEKTSLGWKSECDSGRRYLRTLCRTELFAGNVLESQFLDPIASTQLTSKLISSAASSSLWLLCPLCAVTTSPLSFGLGSLEPLPISCSPGFSLGLRTKPWLSKEALDTEASLARS